MYSQSTNLTDRYAADKVSLIKRYDVVAAILATMKTETKIGMGMKSKKKTKKKMTKKQLLPTVNRGGTFPFLPIIRRARVLDHRSGQRGESRKR